MGPSQLSFSFTLNLRLSNSRKMELGFSFAIDNSGMYS